MEWHHITYFQNNSDSQVPVLQENSLLLGRFTKVIESKFEGPSEIDDFSCVNRSEMGYGSGIGVSSYVSDAQIGRHTMIGSRVSIGGFEHPITWLSVAPFQWGQSIDKFNLPEDFVAKLKGLSKPKPRYTYIGSDVWIGNNSVIKAGVKIEHGAVVGAGSVVTKNIGPYEVHAGNPTRFLKHRFDPNQIKLLMELEWWNLEFEQICSLNFQDIDKCLRDIQSFKKEET